MFHHHFHFTHQCSLKLPYSTNHSLAATESVLSAILYFYKLILTSKCLHVLDSHAQDSQLVQLTGHGITGGYQRRQLVDEAVHLVPATLLDLAVSLSVEEEEKDALALHIVAHSVEIYMLQCVKFINHIQRGPYTQSDI